MNVNINLGFNKKSSDTFHFLAVKNIALIGIVSHSTHTHTHTHTPPKSLYKASDSPGALTLRTLVSIILCLDFIILLATPLILNA